MELLTTAEASDYLKMSKRAIYNRVHRRQIPFIKIGKSLRFSKSQLNDWMKLKSFTPVDN